VEKKMIKLEEKKEVEMIAISKSQPEKEMKTVIKLENLSKKFGDFYAVSNVNLEVFAGETIGLVGPNGAGKTTTIKMIAKLLRPSSGRILIENFQGELQDLSSNSKNIVRRGFLIDVPFFYKDMTANQLLKYFGKSQNYPRDKINKRIDDLLELFNLSDWKHKKVKTFSKGMRQKLGIIQSILVDPQILVLDEPQTGLDPKARIEIRKFIKELQNQGKSIFVASHMLHEISEVCDKIALINHGKIIAFDTIENLEKDLKTKEIDCKLLDPIPSENSESLIRKLHEKLEMYLDKDLDPDISKIPIKYDSDKKTILFYYNGEKRARAEILEILITQFKSDFSVVSYSRPKTSQLERIYSEMIKDESPKITLNNGRYK
jgi:ABC-2 type transport system ATP-binding protein